MIPKTMAPITLTMTMVPITLTFQRWADMRGGGDMSIEEIARRAVMLADAMLVEVNALRAVASPSARVRHRAAQMRGAR